MRNVLRAGTQMEHRKNLREWVDGQPEKDAHVWNCAAWCAAVVQLEVWELQGAKGALVQRLSVHGLRVTERPVMVGCR